MAIGSTSFDGFSNGPAWADLSPHLQSLFSDLGAGQELALELASTVGLLFFVGLVACSTGSASRGCRRSAAVTTPRELMGRFAHSLIPIAFAYAVAHYFSLLVYQSQAMAYLISDPLGRVRPLRHRRQRHRLQRDLGDRHLVRAGRGARVRPRGRADARPRPALATYPDPREATRSQYWMLVVMVGFTSLGLWLLSAVSR